MKKKVFQLAGAFMLTAGLLFTVNMARATDETGNKEIQETTCCKNGGNVAHSSDCIRGGDSCLDNTCPAGSTEQAGPECVSGGGGGGGNE